MLFRAERKVSHYPHRPHLVYQTTLGHHLASVGIVIALVAVSTVLILHFANPRNTFVSTA
jgi:hypothetical protein